MKARINLYQEEFYPHFEWVTGSHLVISTIFAALLSGMGYLALLSWHQDLDKELSLIQENISAEQRNIDEFTNALQTRIGNPVLAAERTQLQKELASQEALLSRVQDLGQMKQSAFSELFNALANADSEHVWISSFIVNERDLTIRGSLAQPSALTRWIGDLSNTAYFKGQEFDDALLLKENDALNFQLTSTELIESEKSNDQPLVARGGANAAN